MAIVATISIRYLINNDSLAFRALPQGVQKQFKKF